MLNYLMAIKLFQIVKHFHSSFWIKRWKSCEFKLVFKPINAFLLNSQSTLTETSDASDVLNSPHEFSNKKKNKNIDSFPLPATAKQSLWINWKSWTIDIEFLFVCNVTCFTCTITSHCLLYTTLSYLNANTK